VSEVSSGRIFLSYRRKDTRYVAARLSGHLADRFGADNVFMDVNSIEPGVDFVEAIENAVGRCDVFLALIGELWLGATAEQGHRRIDNPDDPVALEIKTALQRQIRVIPVLVDGAAVPQRHELPDALAPLARRNGVPLRFETFDTDLSRLITTLDRVLQGAERTRDQTTAASQHAATTSAAPHPTPPARPHSAGKSVRLDAHASGQASITQAGRDVHLHHVDPTPETSQVNLRRGAGHPANPHDPPAQTPTPNAPPNQPSPDKPTRSEPVTAPPRQPSPTPIEQAPTEVGPAQNTNTARESPPAASTAHTATARVDPTRSPSTPARVTEERAVEKPSTRHGAPKTATDTAIVRTLPSTADTTVLTRVLRKLAQSRRTRLILAGVVLAAALLPITLTKLVPSTPTIPVGQYPWDVALTPDGRHAYITNTGSDSVSVIDTASNTITATIPVDQGPEGVALAPDGRRAYITNTGSDSVSVIDTASNTITATISAGQSPEGVALAPDGRYAYITHFDSGLVSVIDTAGNTITATIPVVGKYPRDVALAPNGRHAYITNTGSNSMSVIDTASNTITAIPAGQAPEGVALAPDGRHAYITNWGSNSVSVIDTDTNTITATIPVGQAPVGVALAPDGRHAYITNSGSDSVSVIDTGG
jgi:YVTN family beta-propeller protein